MHINSIFHNIIRRLHVNSNSVSYSKYTKICRDKYWRFPKSKRAAGSRSQQIYDFFLVLDFEATCAKEKKLPIQEVIEFPCIKINGMTMEVESVFHQYVQPIINPTLTDFCTQLTGITQEMIEDQCDFRETLKKFDMWLKEQGVCNDKSVFVTSGDWDLQVLLPTQCQNENIVIPPYFNSWINIKQAFADATGHFPHGILHMMHILNIKHTGRLHSGIDDCRNIAQILKILANNDHIFHKTGYSMPTPIVNEPHPNL